MDEFVRITVVSGPAESQADFNKRLIDFWTRVLRTFPEEYTQVYAETSSFERDGSRVSRQYLLSLGVSELMERELRQHGLDCKPIDREDLYSKYEGVPPEWFQIPH